MADQPIVLVVGDPASGFEFYGPTVANDPALEELTETLGRSQSWWYVDLKPIPRREVPDGVPR